MSGQWPPEWGEPDWEDQDQEGTAADSGAAGGEHPELAAVTAALAALPVPALPEAVEARITAALTAEAAARATGTTASTEPAAHVLDASRPRSLPPRRRKRRFRLIAAIAPLAVCLLLGVGYLVSRTGASSGPAGTALSPYAAGGNSIPASAGGAMPQKAPASDLRPLAAGERPAFVVTATGTRYLRATLAPQLRQALAASRSSANAVPVPPSGRPAVTAAAEPTSSTAGGFSSAESSAAPAHEVFAPSKSLAGCVLKVTGKAVPTLVEYATYQGTPVYVIVLPDRAWIVGTGCTASDPRVIVSVPMAG